MEPMINCQKCSSVQVLLGYVQMQISLLNIFSPTFSIKQGLKHKNLKQFINLTLKIPSGRLMFWCQKENFCREDIQLAWQLCNAGRIQGELVTFDSTSTIY